ncbi:MAG: hypothetical protein HZB54_03590 [Deltaproteobacteria bacterium]|nr:hypothetical protein [Deltaproteobacteria bacterium]
MENMNRGDKSGMIKVRSQESGVRSQNQEIRSKRRSCLLPLASHHVPFFLLLTAYCLLPTVLYAAQEMLKTQKVKVGENAPLTEMLKKINQEKKVIVLTLLPNPMGCRRCDSLVNLLEKETEKYKDNSSFIMAGGQDMLGADQETLELKRLYGFVTMGDAWTFIIDREGVLRKILIGLFTGEELEGILDNIIGRKE